MGLGPLDHRRIRIPQTLTHPSPSFPWSAAGFLPRRDLLISEFRIAIPLSRGPLPNRQSPKGHPFPSPPPRLKSEPHHICVHLRVAVLSVSLRVFVPSVVNEKESEQTMPSLTGKKPSSSASSTNIPLAITSPKNSTPRAASSLSRTSPPKKSPAASSRPSKSSIPSSSLLVMSPRMKTSIPPSKPQPKSSMGGAPSTSSSTHWPSPPPRPSTTPSSRPPANNGEPPSTSPPTRFSPWPASPSPS